MSTEGGRFLPSRAEGFRVLAPCITSGLRVLPGSSAGTTTVLHFSLGFAVEDFMRRPSLHRSLLAATSLLVLQSASALAAGNDHIHTIVCGEHLLHETKWVEVPPEGLQIAEAPLTKRAAQITLNAGPGLLANQPALDTWNRAVSIWESVLDDNVVLVIDGDLAALDPGVLGATSSATFRTSYDSIRNQVVADRDPIDEGFVLSLPTAAQFNRILPPGFTYAGELSTTKAVFKAIGFDMSGFPGADATITFSTGFAPDFDYDAADGIAVGKFDFEAIVVHEIGHALGFTSTVDVADFLRDSGQVGELRPSVLDLYRLLPGAGATNFTTASRVITTGDLQPTMAFWDGTQDLLLSTGVALGDGRQASHWKANELTGGNFIGIMDPTLSRGERAELTVNDLRAFGLIGWDVVYPVAITDCNGNGIDDALDISGGAEQDCNANGVPDSCDISGGASADANGDGVPNECEAVASPAPVRAQLFASPNPFNPRTEIRFVLAQAGSVRLDVYDVAGRRVTTLAARDFEAGEHRMMWEGLNSENRAVSSGVYLVVLRTQGDQLLQKVTLIE